MVNWSILLSSDKALKRISSLIQRKFSALFSLKKEVTFKFPKDNVHQSSVSHLTWVFL